MAEGGHKDEYTFPNSEDDLEWEEQSEINIVDNTKPQPPKPRCIYLYFPPENEY